MNLHCTLLAIMWQSRISQVYSFRLGHLQVVSRAGRVARVLCGHVLALPAPTTTTPKFRFLTFSLSFLSGGAGPFLARCEDMPVNGETVTGGESERET